MKLVKQQWMALFFIPVLAAAIIAGCTRPIVVPTLPGLNNTPTATLTATNPAVSTATSTPTKVTVSTGTGPSSPGNSNQVQGATGIPVLQLSATNPSGTTSSTLTSLTLSASGSGTDNTGITAVKLYRDTNNNGIVDGGDTLLDTSTYGSDNGTVIFNFSNAIAPSSTANFLVVYDFSGTAPAGTYQASLASNTDAAGTDGGSQALLFSGAPVNGAVITIAGNTSTPTKSSTATSTSTLTLTRTSTSTLTRTPTSTLTATGASTSTSTSTPSLTSTRTNTTTPTNTATSSGCPLALAAPYTFDSSIGCWVTNNVLTTTTANWISNPPAGSPGGGGAFHANVTYSGSAQLTEEFEVPLPANTDLTGKVITMSIYIDGSVQGTAWGGGIQPYVKTGSGFAFCSASWTNISGFGNWYTYTLDLNTTCTSGLTDVRTVGVQVIVAAGGSSGNLYIDDVRIATPPTMTPTKTDTPFGVPTPTMTPTFACPLALAAPYSFDTDPGCWKTNNVLTTTTADWVSSAPAGSSSGGGAFHGNVTYSGSAQLTEEFEVPLPANTDLTGKTITMKIYIDPSVQGAAWGGGIQPYIKTGAAFSFCSAPWTNIGGFGGWYTYTLDLTTNCTSGLTDVRTIGVQVIVAAGGSSGNIYIDDVQITGGASPSTSTPTPTPSPTTMANTDTPTNTPTITPTTAACPFPLAAPYTFDSSVGCWVTNNVLTTTTADWASSAPAGSTSGGGSFHANVTYSGSAQLTEEFEVPLPASTNLTGKVITMKIYIDNSVKGTAWGGGIQPYIKTGAAYSFCSASWVNITGFGGWYSYTLDLNSSCTTGLTDVRTIGVQVIIAAGGSSGNIYIDDVTVADPVVPTPTPTAVTGWDFESGSLTDSRGTWVLSTGGVSSAIAVTAPGIGGSSYAMEVTGAFTANDQIAGAEIGLGTPINGTTFNGVRASIWIGAAATDAYPGGVIQLGDGTNYPFSSWTNLVKNGWLILDFPASSWGALNKANINFVKVWANVGGGGTAWATVPVRIDNVEFY